MIQTTPSRPSAALGSLLILSPLGSPNQTAAAGVEQQQRLPIESSTARSGSGPPRIGTAVGDVMAAADRDPVDDHGERGIELTPQPGGRAVLGGPLVEDAEERVEQWAGPRPGRRRRGGLGGHLSVADEIAERLRAGPCLRLEWAAGAEPTLGRMSARPSRARMSRHVTGTRSCASDAGTERAAGLNRIPRRDGLWRAGDRTTGPPTDVTALARGVDASERCSSRYSMTSSQPPGTSHASSSSPPADASVL